MTRCEFGDPTAPNVLLQPTGAHELAGLDREYEEIRARTDAPFRLLAVPVENWNRDLSPWPAPPVFGDEPFGGGAAGTLQRLASTELPEAVNVIVGGYSLAGLFALWACLQTDRFYGAAAASPSVWFPGFTAYFNAHPVLCKTAYLSLGDAEEKAKNPTLASVGDCARECAARLRRQGIPSVLELNPGNHFREPEIRTAKAFAWVLNRIPQA